MKTKMVGYNKDKAEYLIMKRCVKENCPLSVTEYSKKIGFSHDYLSKAASDLQSKNPLEGRLMTLNGTCWKKVCK